MSALEHLGRQLVASVAERRTAAEVASTGRTTRSGGRGGRLWRRPGRGSRGLIVLGGIGLALGVGTGAAEVVGVNPWSFMDRFTAHEDAYWSPGRIEDRLTAHAPAGSRVDWKVEAYLTSRRQLCFTGATLVARESGLGCTPSVDAVQSIVGGDDPALVIASTATAEGTQRRPRSILVFGLAAPGVREVRVALDEERGSTAPLADSLTVPVDQTRVRGLAPDALARLRALPARVRLHAFAVVVPVPAAVRDRPIGSAAIVRGPSDGVAQIRIRSIPRTGGPPVPNTLGHFSSLEQYPVPVSGPTAKQVRAIPALARTRMAADRVDGRLPDEYVRYGAQPSAARRLQISAYGAQPDPIWAVPARGRLCLFDHRGGHGNCTPDAFLMPSGALQAAICSPFLDPDRREIYGLPAAGADAVRLRFTSGRPLVLAAHDYLVINRDRRDPPVVDLAWRIDGRWGKAIRTPFPADAARDQCAR